MITLCSYYFISANNIHVVSHVFVPTDRQSLKNIIRFCQFGNKIFSLLSEIKTAITTPFSKPRICRGQNSKTLVPERLGAVSLKKTMHHKTRLSAFEKSSKRVLETSLSIDDIFHTYTHTYIYMQQTFLYCIFVFCVTCGCLGFSQKKRKRAFQ